jgi:hypothetical protein
MFRRDFLQQLAGLLLAPFVGKTDTQKKDDQQESLVRAIHGIDPGIGTYISGDVKYIAGKNMTIECRGNNLYVQYKEPADEIPCLRPVTPPVRMGTPDTKQ